MSRLITNSIEATSGTFGPTMSSKPCFYAYMSSGSFAPDASNATKTPLNATEVNIGDCWNIYSHEFTAPIAGTYSISWGVTFGADADEGRYMANRIYKNGSQIGSAHRNRPTTAQGGNQYSGVDLSMMLPFAVGETFYVILQPSSTITVAAEYGTYMQGFLIG